MARALVLAAAVLIGGGAAPRLNNNRLADFPRRFPIAFKAFRDSAPDALLNLPYIGSLDNAAGDGEIRQVTMDGQVMVRAFSCLPHDCVDQTLTVIFTPDQKRVVAVAKIINSRLKFSYVIMGEPSPRELTCLIQAARLDFEARNSKC